MGSCSGPPRLLPMSPVLPTSRPLADSQHQLVSMVLIASPLLAVSLLLCLALPPHKLGWLELTHATRSLGRSARVPGCCARRLVCR